jgi:hypothetical protein
VNERIQELALQANLQLDNLPDDTFIPLEKFAELIITDIFNVMHDQKTYNRCTYTTHDLDKARCVVHEVIKCVNEHFGTKL